MYGSQVTSDFDLSGVVSNFPSLLDWGRSAFQTRLHNESTADVSEIKRRQLPLLALRQDSQLCEKWTTQLICLQKITPDVNECLKPQDDLFNETTTQIFWSPSSYASFLNKQSIVVNSLVFWKTIVIPFFAVLLPLLTLILPYFLLHYIGRGVSVSTYITQIRRILVNQMSVPTMLRSKGDHDSLGYVLESLFVALTLGAFGSGIWNQLTSALHLRKIWWSLEARGAAVLQALATARSLCDDMMNRAAFRHLAAEGDAALKMAEMVVGADAISTFGAFLDTGASGVRAVCEWIGKVDVYVTLASGKYGHICVPQIAAETETKIKTKPIFAIKQVRHPLIKTCISNNLHDASHVILTGPNRGGKSTFCKAVGLSAIFAQTWGFACADAMKWTPFAEIHSALETNGRIGFNSTFEAEIEFAKEVLNAAKRGTPLLVMMDEIFHSTNAVDGVAASKVFLSQLYEISGSVSILSTHYSELAKIYENQADARQLMATSDDGVITYHYKVIHGISDTSSVMEILREKGLTE